MRPLPRGSKLVLGLLLVVAGPAFAASSTAPRTAEDGLAQVRQALLEAVSHINVVRDAGRSLAARVGLDMDSDMARRFADAVNYPRAMHEMARVSAMLALLHARFGGPLERVAGWEDLRSLAATVIPVLEAASLSDNDLKRPAAQLAAAVVQDLAGRPDAAIESLRMKVPHPHVQSGCGNWFAAVGGMSAIIKTSMHLRAGQDALALMSLRGYIGRQDYILDRTLATPVAALDAWLRFRTGDRAGAEPICHRLAREEAGTIEGDIATRCLRAWDASGQGRSTDGPAPAETIGEVHPPATSSTTMEDLTRRYLTGRSVTLAPPPTLDDDDLNAGHPPSRVRDLWKRQRLFTALRAKYGAPEPPRPDPDEARRSYEERLAEAKRLCRDLPGFDRIDPRFTMSPPSLGAINGHGFSLHVMLDARDPGPHINYVWWFDPTDEATKKPRRDWNDLLAALATVEDAASHHPWMRQWRDATPDRQLQACILGRKAMTRINPEFLVTTAWKHAGLAGRPTIEIAFRRGKTWCGHAFLGPDDPRALVVKFTPGTGDHWLDDLKVDFHPLWKHISYIVVDRNGDHRVCDEVAPAKWTERMRTLAGTPTPSSDSDDEVD